MKKASLDATRSVPLYRQCFDTLKKAIETGKHPVGSFLPSERDLSEKFGVNRITLRKALAEIAREGLIENVPGAGNKVVAARRKTAENRIVSCVMLRFAGMPMMSPYYADLLEGIEEETASRGFDLLFQAVPEDTLRTPDNQPRPSPKIPGTTRLLGALLVGGITDELAAAYQKKGVQVVLVDKPSPSRDLSSIMPDNFDGAYKGAKHLVELGHRRIAFLAARNDPVVESRHGGFLKALADSGVAFHRKDYIEGSYTTEAAEAAMTRFLQQRRKDLPTALMAINDEAAIGALHALRSQGIAVPNDVSVIGFDDIPWASHAHPSLTTLRIPRREMGRVAAQTLLNQIESPRPSPIRLVLQTDLIVRKSCARPTSSG